MLELAKHCIYVIHEIIIIPFYRCRNEDSEKMTNFTDSLFTEMG